MEWELSIKFTFLASKYLPLQTFLSGTGRWLISPLQSISKELSNMLAEEPPISGKYNFVAVFDLPNNFAENYGEIFSQCMENYHANQNLE
jgi:hypothetical protein